MNMEEQHNNMFSFAIAIVVVLVCVFFLSYSFQMKNNNYNKSLNKNDLNKLAQEKFTSISNKRDLASNELIFFNENSLDINNISKENILYIAYTLISKEDTIKSGEVLDECFGLDKDNYPEKCYLEVIDKNLLDEQIRNYFSSNINVSYNEFNISANQTCYFKDNIYNCYLNRNPVTINDYKVVNVYDSYEYNDNKLEVYSYLLTIRDTNSKLKEDGIFSDSKATKLIDNLDYYTNTLNKQITGDNAKKLVDHYKDDISKYKSTFVKENDNYVWLSTEKVK